MTRRGRHVRGFARLPWRLVSCGKLSIKARLLLVVLADMITVDGPRLGLTAIEARLPGLSRNALLGGLEELERRGLLVRIAAERQTRGRRSARRTRYELTARAERLLTYERSRKRTVQTTGHDSNGSDPELLNGSVSEPLESTNGSDSEPSTVQKAHHPIARTQEQNGKNGKNNADLFGDPQPATAERLSDAKIDQVYAAYPRRVGRGAARKAIRAALGKIAKRGEKDPVAWLLARVQRYAEQRRGENPKFTPHPATWFNSERYDDDDGSAVPGTAGEPARARYGGSRARESRPETFDATVRRY